MRCSCWPTLCTVDRRFPRARLRSAAHGLHDFVEDLAAERRQLRSFWPHAGDDGGLVRDRVSTEPHDVVPANRFGVLAPTSATPASAIEGTKIAQTTRVKWMTRSISVALQDSDAAAQSGPGAGGRRPAHFRQGGRRSHRADKAARHCYSRPWRIALSGEILAGLDAASIGRLSQADVTQIPHSSGQVATDESELSDAHSG